MLDLLKGIFGVLLDLITSISWPPSNKPDKNMEELLQEEWFKQIYSDYRYRHVIDSTWKISRFLDKTENVEKLKNDLKARDEFIKWVKDEHEIITWGKKRDKV